LHARNKPRMVSETLSDKARRVLLKLDSGCLIGSAEKLRVGSADATAAVLVDADRSFQLGRLAEKDVQRLESMLLEMHAKIPGAAPLRTNSSAISSLKRKASDLYQARVCDPRADSCESNETGCARTQSDHAAACTQDAATPRAFADANGHQFAGELHPRWQPSWFSARGSLPCGLLFELQTSRLSRTMGVRSGQHSCVRAPARMLSP